MRLPSVPFTSSCTTIFSITVFRSSALSSVGWEHCLKYQPDEHDKTTYQLQSAHVDEGDYFVSRVHKDMDGILEDLRKAHIGRSDGAPKSTVAEELKRDLEEVVNFEGSHTELRLLVFCRQTKLRYNKLSEFLFVVSSNWCNGVEPI